MLREVAQENSKVAHLVHHIVGETMLVHRFCVWLLFNKYLYIYMSAGACDPCADWHLVHQLLFM